LRTVAAVSKVSFLNSHHTEKKRDKAVVGRENIVWKMLAGYSDNGLNFITSRGCVAPKHTRQ
jgi:hypothetical protein